MGAMSGREQVMSPRGAYPARVQTVQDRSSKERLVAERCGAVATRTLPGASLAMVLVGMHLGHTYGRR
jgi:hypothetical protein